MLKGFQGEARTQVMDEFVVLGWRVCQDVGALCKQKMFIGSKRAMTAPRISQVAG